MGSCVPPPTMCVCIHKLVHFESAREEDAFILYCLDDSYLKDVCVGKQRTATTHSHTQTHTHVASSTILNFQAHTYGNVSTDYNEVRQDSEKGALCIWGTQIWRVFLNKS